MACSSAFLLAVLLVDTTVDQWAVPLAWTMGVLKIDKMAQKLVDRSASLMVDQRVDYLEI